MNEEKQTGQSKTANKQAVVLLKALSHFDYPEEIQQIPAWLDKTKPLTTFIRTLCEKDSTGSVTHDCISVLYEMMANDERVSPAVWNILQVVSEDDLKEITDAYLTDTTRRLKNALCGLVTAACYCGLTIPELHNWCHAFITGLENRQKYSVLHSTSRVVIPKLLQGLMLMNSRKATYDLFERLLYPMDHPQVFNTIAPQIPKVLSVLENEKTKEAREVLGRLRVLVKALVNRFPSESPLDDKLKPALIGSGDIKAYGSTDTSDDTTISRKTETAGDMDNSLSYTIWHSKPTDPLISTILKCPVCYERFFIPIMVCENGHCICSSCKDQLQTCPICRVRFSNIRLTIMNQIMEATEFYCKNYDSGCLVKMPYNDIWNHEEECEYRTVSCDIITSHDPSDMMCNEDVVVFYFHRHVEKFHSSFVIDFELNTERKGRLHKRWMNEVRLLRNSESGLYFIERVYATDDQVSFSCHYIGKNTDAKNYMYTIKINGKTIQGITYRNFCLPNYKGVYETEEDGRSLVLEPEKIFCDQQTEVEYSVKIENVSVHRLRTKRNKFMVEI